MALPSLRDFRDYEDTNALDNTAYESPLSAGYQYATGESGIGEDQYFSNIKNYVMNVLGSEGMSNADKAANIRAAAEQYGVSNEDIARATGYGIGTVNVYLDPRTYATQQDSTASSVTSGASSVTAGDSGVTGGASNVTAPGASDDEITALYQQVLGRAPDQGGFDFWKNSGYTADQIRDQFLLSDEYQNRVGAVPTTTGASDAELTSLYRDVLGREPDEAGFEFWKSSGYTPEQIREQFLLSDEYQAKSALDQAASTLGQTSRSDTIRNYVVNVLSSEGTDAEKARNIADAARNNNVSMEELAAATGFTVDQVNAYLANATVNPGANADTANAVVAKNGYFAANPDVAKAYQESGAAASMSPEEFAEKHWKENGRYEGRTGPKGEAPNDADKMYDYRGQAYDKDVILKLASQIIPNLGSMGGGAFGTKGESIGFDFNEAKRILGKDPSAAEQVILDMARSLVDKGITDISQLQVKDVFSDINVTELTDEYGQPTGQYVATFVDPNNPDQYTQRILTKEEADRITSETIYDAEGGAQIRKTANDILSGKALYAGDTLLNQVVGTINPLAIHLGGTATGKGSTEYQIIINPATGKPEFTSYGRDSSGLGALSAVLTVASFIPGVQPFAMLANAAIAASQGNTLGALASLAGAGGFTNVATALNVANAVDKGNIGAVVTTLLANPTVANAAGSTMLTDTISLADVGSAINIAAAVEKGDLAAVLTGAGKLTGSADLTTAGTAAEIINAVQTGNIGALTNSVMKLNGTINAAENLNNTETITTLVNNVTNGSITDSGAVDLGEATYVAAINAGATEEEALNAANAVTNTNAVTGNNNTTTTKTGDVKTDIMSGVTAVDTEFGNLDKAISEATARNTLNIANADANSLEEAAALAGARGFTNFTYGGKTYAMSATAQEVAAQATAANIAAAKNFGDAYSLARKELGPGQVFEWNGKKYSTDTREENPSLAKASDQIRYAELGAGAGRGSYAGYDAKAAADSWAKLNTKVLDNATSLTDTIGTMDDFLKLGGLQGDYVVVGDGISKQLVDPVIKTIGTVVRAGGNFLDNMAGGLQSVNVIDKNSGIVRIANDMQKWGSDRMGDYLIGAEKNVMDRVSKADGFANKFTELGKALWDNPSAILTLGANEVFEEGGPLAAGGMALRYGGKLLALGVDAFMNAWEAGGANYNDTKKAAIDAGMSESDAHTAAQKSAAGAGAVASVLGPVADMPWLKRAGSVGTGAAESSTKAVTKAATKEAATEYPEEGIASIMSDYFATGTIDLNKAMTQGTVGSVIAGKAVGTITVVSEVANAGNSTTEIVNSVAGTPDQAAALTNAINSSFKPGMDLKAAGADIVTAMTASGMNTAQAQNVANTAVAEQVLNNLSATGGLNINNLNIAVGKDSSGNAVTLGDFIGSSVTGAGIDGKVYVAPDIFIGTNSQGKPITVGDLSNLSSVANNATTTSNASGSSTTVTGGGNTVSTSTDNNTGATTNITTNADTGTQTNTSTNNNTGVNSSTTTNAKTGTETTTTTDANTGTTTKTETNSNTGTSTSTTTDTNNNTNTSVTTNNNTGTTTETTTNNNTGTTTQTTTDTTTGTTTTTSTNTNTNTNTSTTTDTNTNTQTTTNTNTNTNVTTQTTVNNNTGTTTTSTTDTNGNVTSEVTTDTKNNTETTTTTDVNTNTSTTVVVDTNTNTVISSTVTPVTEIKKIDPVETVPPVEKVTPEPEVKPEEETEEEKKKKKARKLTTGAGTGMGLMGGEITGIKPQMLRSFVTGEKKLDPLERVKEIQEEMEREAMIQNVDPRLAAILQQRMGGGQQEDLSGLDTLARVLSGGGFDPEKAAADENSAYYSYGKEDSIDDILGASAPVGFAEGGFVEPLMAQGGMTLPLMAKEGGLPKMAKGREDFRDGKHVAGEGDGQSDDIPAMLADGEFVFPADVVSALGNGSTKAGTDKLYKMMHEIRARARSTGNKDLPPPALKSPLDYLKSKR